MAGGSLSHHQHSGLQGIIIIYSHDARRSRGEKDEQAGGQEDGYDGSDELGDELVAGLRSEKVARLQITSHIGSLGGRASSNDTSRKIEHLTGSWVHARALTDTTKDELGGLGNGTNRVDIRLTGTLDTDEGEEESEQKCQDGFADIHVELSGEDGAAHDSAEEQAS